MLDLSLQAYTLYAPTNPVSRRAFPSVGELQDDILASALALMGAQGAECGTLTSGGTESIFLAMLGARERWRARGGQGTRRVILPETAHPAFNKLAFYLGAEVVRVPTGADHRADPAAMEAAVLAGPAMMIVASATGYPCGLFDPIKAVAEVARRHDLWMHVDACIGGFQSPFVRALGYPVPAFGFVVPGVFSISADLHKYGFALKGASVVLFASEELRAPTLFRFDDWPRGLYATDSFSGTRSGGPVAPAWSVMRYLGFDGYLDLNRRIMTLRDRIIAELTGPLECEIIGAPGLSLFAFRPRGMDLNSLTAEIARTGWILDLVRKPEAVQIMLNISHEDHADQLLSDLKAAFALARSTDSTDIRAEY